MRLSTKPDASFFQKIAIGAVGTQAVCEDLATLGHDLRELERGALETKIWKDVKRKRVRIPDLICVNCGLRVESRAKRDAALAMSHSGTEAERAWDFGMVDTDLVAFPVCQPTAEADWSVGSLRENFSYWRERNLVKWRAEPWINYITVAEFRTQTHSGSSTKGVTEGSETSIEWSARFSPRDGVVTAAVVSGAGSKLSIAKLQDGKPFRPHTWTIPPGLKVLVQLNDPVARNQLFAASVSPRSRESLECPGGLTTNGIALMLDSKERTVRFAGIKLARLRSDPFHVNAAEGLSNDNHEDVYVRLEAVSYLVSVCGYDPETLFRPHMDSTEESRRLEAVIAVVEAGTDKCAELLAEVLADSGNPFYLRSAAAWGLGRIGGEFAVDRLTDAFSDVELRIREDALDALAQLGQPGASQLLASLDREPEVAAGAAEVLRRITPPQEVLTELVTRLFEAPGVWSVWLAGTLPKELLFENLHGLQEKRPEVHFAVSVLYAFMDSWISRTWEKQT